MQVNNIFAERGVNHGLSNTPLHDVHTQLVNLVDRSSDNLLPHLIVGLDCTLRVRHVTRIIVTVEFVTRLPCCPSDPSHAIKSSPTPTNEKNYQIRQNYELNIDKIV